MGRGNSKRLREEERASPRRDKEEQPKRETVSVRETMAKGTPYEKGDCTAREGVKDDRLREHRLKKQGGRHGERKRGRNTAVGPGKGFRTREPEGKRSNADMGKQEKN